MQQMSDLQLWMVVGLPVLAVLASLTVSLVQISGIRDDMRELRRDMKDLRQEVNTKMDLLMGKVYELMQDRHSN
jgi:type II secretory pathway component PulL